ncbi:MAG: aspartate aminotransferase family protein [Candidatus Acididesulfobacter guangdongensis]|uniref:Acetylornithine aminotransferase n=1 Tax=Acididesulfobacter guangdongensis TaxID=2597225 RepID=A0A519BGE3_ACIG2|nr:MAG: aspartate aminotransferase family protein [Candidatus Acididesulfobacter guangdongensis]
MNTKELTAKYIMNTYSRFDLELTKGSGTELFDEKGKRYIDFAAGIAVNNLGYNNEAINNAVIDQLKKLIHVSNYFYTEPQALLAQKLVENSFASKVFFCNSGAESIEGAIKLARSYSSKISKRGYKIISMNNSFHGRTFGALAATGQEKYRKGFEPLLPGFDYVDYNDIKQIENLIDGNDDYCAILIEPVQGEGGVNIASRDYIKKIREITEKNNMLLIFDEVQAGLGRTGKLFAYMNFDVEPDIMTLAKPLAGGLPIGAVLATQKAADAFEPGNHASTFGGGPLVCSAANAFMDEILEKDFLKNVTEKGLYLKEKLIKLKEKFSGKIKEIRSIGLISAIEFYDLKSKDVAIKLINMGFLTTTVQEKAIRLTPPLIIGVKEIDLICSAMDEILSS